MQAYEEISRLRAQLEDENRYLRVFKAIETVAPAGTTVLILGGNGDR